MSTEPTGTRSFGYDADLRLDTEELDADFFDNRILTRLVSVRPVTP